jgi:uncharacterized protein YndB with AHSA1/START domain
MTDLASWVGSIHRKVSAEDTDAGRARSVLLRHTFQAPVHDVWAAVTEPRKIAEWFYPVSGDLRVGGKYQLEGNASGEIRRCDKPNALALTWDFGGGSTDLAVTLTPEGGNATVLELVHTAVLPFDDATWVAGLGQFAPGWDHTCYRLDRYLAGSLPPGGNPGEMSPEEQRVWELAANAWGDVATAWSR